MVRLRTAFAKGDYGVESLALAAEREDLRADEFRKFELGDSRAQSAEKGVEHAVGNGSRPPHPAHIESRLRTITSHNPRF